MTKILLDENGKIMTNGNGLIYTGSDGGGSGSVETTKIYEHNISIEFNNYLIFKVRMYSSFSEKVTNIASFIKTFTNFSWSYNEEYYEYTMYISDTTFNCSLEVYEKEQIGEDEYRYVMIGLQPCVLQMSCESTYITVSNPDFDLAFDKFLSNISFGRSFRIQVGTYPSLDGSTGSTTSTLHTNYGYSNIKSISDKVIPL